MPPPHTSSPEKRRYDVISGHPPSPLASKRRCVAFVTSSTTTQVATNPIDGLTTDKTSMYTFESPESPEDELKTSITVPEPVTTVQDSFTTMEAETHINRLALRESMTSGKGTEDAYARHIRNYQDFMVRDQALRFEADPRWIMVPPHPITATKVAAFLQFETTRSKRTTTGTDIVGSRLGPGAISQCINALESYRYHHKGSDPRYKGDAEAQLPLRDDERITTYEANSRAKEPERQAESQEAKALGAASDTYSTDELTRGSMWGLQSFRGSKLQVHVGIRDRAMLLIGSATAYRGDNTRRLLLSDLRFHDVPMIDIGPDIKAMALVLLSNQGKCNTTGRIDEQGAFRHRKAELCPIGGLGFYLFSLFHILDKPRPQFAPDYSRDGPLGYRSWYKIFLFPGAGGEDMEMTYENHRKRVNLMHVKNNIAINKVTHAGRPFAAMTARDHRATSDDTRALGNWSQNGSYRDCYDRTLPTDAMLAAASFNGRKQESFFVARDTLNPPENLCESIFPWVEGELTALQARRDSLGRVATDVSLSRFLTLLQRLRRVILQDAAVLSVQYPDCAIFKYPPFSSPHFTAFAATADLSIEQAEEEARNRISALPETIAGSLRGIVTSSHLQQARIHDELRHENARLATQLKSMDLTLRAFALGSNSRRRKAVMALAGPNPHIIPPRPTVPSACLASAPPLATNASTSTPPFLPNLQPLNSSTNSSMVSLSGKIYPSTSFPLSRNPLEREKQLAYISILETKFSSEKMSKHQFHWIQSSTESQDDEWRPVYFYWKPELKNTSPSIEEIWTEYVFGMNGYLSVRDLNTGWGSRWRGSGPARTETSRRKKITKLIETLAEKPNWTPELALRFLKSQYFIPNPSIPHLKTTRAFIDRLQKADGQLLKEIEERAKTFVA